MRARQITQSDVVAAFDEFKRAVPAPPSRAWVLEATSGHQYGLMHCSSQGGGGALLPGPIGADGRLGSGRETCNAFRVAIRTAEYLGIR